MSALPATAAPTASQTSANAPRRPRNRHRNRGGRANAENGAPTTGTQLVPASIAPAAMNTENSHASGQGFPTRGGRGGRRGGRGRGGDQSGVSRPQSNISRTVQGGRRFGGQLTTEEDETSSQASAPQLYAEASEFVPGQPVAISKAPRPRAPPQPRKRRMSKSTAPDVSTPKLF
jgi:transcriptional repressor NF-X1